MEIAVYFFYKYSVNRKTGVPSTVELDWGILFGSFGSAYIFYIYGDFFAVNRTNFLILGYLALEIGGIIYLYHLESTKRFNTKYWLTLIAIIFLCMFLILFFVAPSILQSVASFISFYAFGVIIVYFLIIIQKIWSFYKLFAISLFLGIFLWLLGYMGTADFSVKMFGTLNIRIIGDISILTGMVIVTFCINTIPSMAEIGWRDKIKYIILATNSGINLYCENFQKKAEVSEVLISGGLFGVQIFLKNILQNKDGLTTLSRGNDAIIIYKGKTILGIMVVAQELEILKYLLKELVHRFEGYFSGFLVKWRGEIAPFHSVKYLIDEIFTTSKL